MIDSVRDARIDNYPSIRRSRFEQICAKSEYDERTGFNRTARTAGEASRTRDSAERVLRGVLHETEGDIEYWPFCDRILNRGLIR